jgi:hypothetical protein
VAAVRRFLESEPSAVFPMAVADIGSVALVVAKVTVENRIAISIEEEPPPATRLLTLPRVVQSAVGSFSSFRLMSRARRWRVSGFE